MDDGAYDSGMATFLLVTLLGFTAGASSACHDGDSIVRRVSFEHTAGLSSVQRSTLNSLLMNQCFYREHGDKLSEAVYRQLRKYGYTKAYVQDPIVRVLNRDGNPSAVSVTIDFVLDYQDTEHK